jgi:hypothetical protein
MELKMQREREREAARIAIQKVYLIIDLTIELVFVDPPD